VADKSVDDFELDSESYTLEELAWGIARRTYDFWETASVKLADLEEPSTIDDIIGRVLRERTETIQRFDYNGLRRIEGESDLRYRRRLQLQRWKEALFERISDRIRSVIGSPDVVTRGIGPTGAPLEIPREIASQIVIDLKTNTLSTPDGVVVWRAVFVCRTAKALPAPPIEPEPALAPAAVEPTPAPTSAPDHPVSDTIIMASMESEILKRRDAGDRTTGPAIVLATADKFRGRVTERYARKLYRKLPKELKGKRGPQGPRISRQNS
jgi:hypothetical protein